ncbi:C40 family peptidase [Melaminivora sp.]
MFRRWLCLLTLVCANAYANPPAPELSPSPTPVTASAERLVERSPERPALLAQFQEMRHQVSDRTSELLTTAMGFIGVPYRRGGSHAEIGFDCSGFVRAAYQQAKGLVLPRRANEQAAATQVIDKKELQPGDLVFFNTMRRTFSHVGIYLGNGKFVHAPRPGAKVRVDDMGETYWLRRFDGARRVSGDSADALPYALQAVQTAQ